MSGYREISRAYQTAVNLRSLRERDADVFDIAASRLHDAEHQGGLPLAKALADNGRLWQTITTLTLDTNNPQPIRVRQSLISIASSVIREMKLPKVNVAFLIEVNRNVAAGLRGVPPSSD